MNNTTDTKPATAIENSLNGVDGLTSFTDGVNTVGIDTRTDVPFKYRQFAIKHGSNQITVFKEEDLKDLIELLKTADDEIDTLKRSTTTHPTHEA